MLKKFEQAYIRKMATQYRNWYPDVTIRKAIHQAVIAYELYREAEIKMMDEAYTKEEV